MVAPSRFDGFNRVLPCLMINHRQLTTIAELLLASFILSHCFHSLINYMSALIVTIVSFTDLI